MRSEDKLEVKYTLKKVRLNLRWHKILTSADFINPLKKLVILATPLSSQLNALELSDTQVVQQVT